MESIAAFLFIIATLLLLMTLIYALFWRKLFYLLRQTAEALRQIGVVNYVCGGLIFAFAMISSVTFDQAPSLLQLGMAFLLIVFPAYVARLIMKGEG